MACGAYTARGASSTGDFHSQTRRWRDRGATFAPRDTSRSTLSWVTISSEMAHMAERISWYMRNLNYRNMAILKGDPRRYLGHDPAGGVMILATLAYLSVITLSWNRPRRGGEPGEPAGGHLAVQIYTPDRGDTRGRHERSFGLHRLAPSRCPRLEPNPRRKPRACNDHRQKAGRLRPCGPSALPRRLLTVDFSAG